MTSYKGHLIAFTVLLMIVFIGLGYLEYLDDINPFEMGLGVFMGYVYCLLPDIDHPGSIIRKKSYLIFGTLTVGCLVVYLTALKEDIFLYVVGVLAVIQLIMLKLKHRGFTHKVVFGALASAPLILISPFVCGMAFLGFISHLGAD